MKDVSGASQMDPRSQVSSLHGVTMLQAAQNSLESNLALALLRETGGPNDRALVNIAVTAFLNLHGTAALAAAEAARESGSAPNAVLAAAAAMVGPRTAEPARRIAALMIELSRRPACAAPRTKPSTAARSRSMPPPASCWSATKPTRSPAR